MSDRLPSYRRHKSSGQAIVTLPDAQGRRRDVLLGKHGTPESRAEYLRVIAEWEASGRRLRPVSGDAPDLSVNELLVAYLEHADRHYRRADGTPTDEIHCIKSAVRPLKQLYGLTPAKDFGPLALKAVRQAMIETIDPRTAKTDQRTGEKDLRTARTWCRRSINLHVCRLRSIFRWAVENELLPSSVLEGLRAVRGLQRGRTEARETEPVKPVSPAWVDAVLPLLASPVAAMVRLQLLAGMRPGEVVIMRGIDLDTSGKVWLYRPGSDQQDGIHKTAWRGHQRVIALGPQAQAVLKPFLKMDLSAYLFSPAESMAEYVAARRKARKTPVQPSQKDRGKNKPKRKPGDRYRVSSYGHAVRVACVKAGCPHWHPHQLRHTRATELRREIGLDAARVVLGHHGLAITETYAELDTGLAAEIMERLG